MKLHVYKHSVPELSIRIYQMVVTRIDMSYAGRRCAQQRFFKSPSSANYVLAINLSQIFPVFQETECSHNSFWTLKQFHLPAQQNSHTFTRSCCQTHDRNIKTRCRHKLFTRGTFKRQMMLEKRDQMMCEWAVARGWFMFYIPAWLLDVTRGSAGNGNASAAGWLPPREFALLCLTLTLTLFTLIITYF